METAPIQLVPPPATDALKGLLTAAPHIFSGDVRVYVATSIAAGQIDDTFPVNGLLTAAPIIRLQEFLSTRPFIEIRQCFVEQNQGGERRVTYDYPDGSLSGRFTIRLPGSSQDQIAFATQAVDQLAKQFNFIRLAEIARSDLSEGERQKLKYYETALQDLTASATKLEAVATEQVIRHAQILDEKRAALDEAHSQKIAELEEDHKKKLAAVEARELEVQAQLKLIDMSKRMIARRQNFEDLKKLITAQKKVDVSADTEKKRGIIKWTSIVVMVGAALVTCYFGWILTHQTTFTPQYFAPFSFAALVFASTLVFFLKWNNQWFAEFAQAELGNRKFNSDIIRANWVAELYLEAKETSQIDLPDTLLNNYTMNLFNEVELRRRDDHISDDLLRLIKRPTKLKVAPHTFEVETREKSET